MIIINLDDLQMEIGIQIIDGKIMGMILLFQLIEKNYKGDSNNGIVC